MSTSRPEQIEEERRLLYVALTRARDHLHVIHPQRMYVRQQHRHGDKHLYVPRTRFLPDPVCEHFERVTHGLSRGDERAARSSSVLAGRPGAPGAPKAPKARVDVAARLRASWSQPGS